MKLAAVGLIALLPGVAHALPDVRVPAHVDLATVAPAVDTNIIFLNRCANGCPITCTGDQTGRTDSVTNQSGLCSGGPHTLTKFKQSDAVWNAVVVCVREVFAPFGVQITDVDPAPAKHFEAMIAGTDTDIGRTGLGGASPWDCNVPYIPNSLVFAFADAYGTDVDRICAVAAQELAHSFRLDHVTEPSDPLTYFETFVGRRHFTDAAVQCGSDCTGSPPRGPFGDACSGPQLQDHACDCTQQPTQNSVATLRAIFGDGSITPPTVTIAQPTQGDQVVAGFAVVALAADDIAVARVELRIDDILVGAVETKPYAFSAPAMLADGTHRVEVIAYDLGGTSARARVDVFSGAPCARPADCATETATCVGGRCVPGAGVSGGLGSPCADDAACSSGLCFEGDSGKLCVETCKAQLDQCPSAFQCIASGSSGVCYPGGAGGGCLSASNGAPPGSIGLGLGFAAYVFARRRRR